MLILDLRDREGHIGLGQVGVDLVDLFESMEDTGGVTGVEETLVFVTLFKVTH